MKEFFRNKITNEPYHYQLKVAETLLEEKKNVILSVPTGAGKTWASIIPFLYAQEKGRNDFPSKMIYSLPLRTLANSIYDDVKEICPATIQTGEYNEDPYFENDIIFSTIDQTLSNFLCFPLALSQRQANINAGALIGSYLVFDEFHLLDPKRSMATTLGTLKMLGNLCRCCIMTATLSSDFMKALKDNLSNYAIITLDEFPEDKEKISSLLPKQNKKKVTVPDNTVSAQTIIERHKCKTITICNRVETAQKIYNDIITLKKNGNLNRIKEDNIICLHSRFFDKDRKAKEAKLKKLFGKEADKNENALLIATQVIEAGMDISCDIMHTEVSPINSFLQRAGRCARFAEEKGEIFIYDLLDIEEKEKIKIEPENQEDKDEIRKINNKYLPYEKKDCITALEELKKVSTLDGKIPANLIETILGDDEKSIIVGMKAGQGGGFNQDKIRESWNACAKNHYRNTIRDIQSVEIVLITDEMITDIEKYPYKYQSLGMYKWSFIGWLNKIVNDEGPKQFDEDDWLVKKLEENNFIGEFENDEDINYQLSKITDFKAIPTQVYVNAKYIGYKASLGFNWQYPDSFINTSPERERKGNDETFQAFKKDTFFQHNMGLINAFKIEFLSEKEKKVNKLDFTFMELAEYLDLKEFLKKDFIQLITAMIILHDYGKLNNTWQNPMQHYQALKEKITELSYKEILAHTDYNAKDDKDIELAKKAGLKKRPAHAGVGAYAWQEIEEPLYDNEYLKSSISMAIARHHSPFSNNFPDFKISDKNYKEIEKLFDKFHLNIELEKKSYLGKLDGFETGWHGEFITYLFLVRILRLCDQKATENLSYYYNNI